MIRTIISLDPEDKAWLDRRAKQERTRMAVLVRRAIRRFREQCGPERSDFDRLLRDTAGTWKRGDGLAYQRRLRREWDRGS